MAMIEMSDADAPLSQGDILDRIELFASEIQETGDWKAARQSERLCLVLSRPCALAHKDKILVAKIQVRNSLPPEVDSFAKTVDFLVSLREGYSAIDRFYLGHLAGRTGRHFACLDSIHTLELSATLHFRKQFIEKHRIATLADDFRRNLQTRLFGSIAYEGFEDHSWMSNQDLEWILSSGEREVAKWRLRLAEAEALVNTRIAAGEKLHKNHELDIASAKKGLSESEAQLGGYQMERLKRSSEIPQ